MSSASKEAPILKIRQIEINTFIHATESEDRILSPIQNLIAVDNEPVEYRLDHCNGTHGQKIDNFQVKLTVQKKIKIFLSQLAKNMTLEAKKRLNEEIPHRLSEKFKLYIRWDKQHFIQNQYQLVEHSDVIQVVIAFQNKNPNSELSLEDIRGYLLKFDVIAL